MALEKTDLPDQILPGTARKKGIIIFRGLMGTSGDWAEKLNMSRSNVSRRLCCMPVEKALKPVRKRYQHGAAVAKKKKMKPRLLPSGIPEIAALDI